MCRLRVRGYTRHSSKLLTSLKRFYVKDTKEKNKADALEPTEIVNSFRSADALLDIFWSFSVGILVTHFRVLGVDLVICVNKSKPRDRLRKALTGTQCKKQQLSANLGNTVELNWGLGLVFKLDQGRIRGKFQWIIESRKWPG
jgi:hypothetical protein